MTLPKAVSTRDPESPEPPAAADKWTVRGIIGPGVITGADDDDPSGIATYSQTGAQFGYGQLWTALFMLPLQIGVQEACARIGAVTGQGLAAAVQERYNRTVLTSVVILVLVANTINIGADLGAMAAAANLIVPVDIALLAVAFAGVVLFLEIVLSYRVYAKVLKWLALSLLAYPLTVAIVHQPWSTILRATLVPHVQLSVAFLFIITGVLETTISPYMFFWETSEEVEESLAKGRLVVGRRRTVGWAEMRLLRIDNVVGMLLSEIATWSIVVVTGTVLHGHGVTDIRTAADAARALEPLVQTFPHAGFLAKAIFATGVIGLGLLGVPVLAGSSAYAFAEAMRWSEGLAQTPRQARGFYDVIAAGTVAGLLMNFVGVDPIKALIYAAVLNGLVAVPLIFLIARIAGSEAMMGTNRSGRLSSTVVWATFGAMGAAAVALVVTLVTG